MFIFFAVVAIGSSLIGYLYGVANDPDQNLSVSGALRFIFTHFSTRWDEALLLVLVTVSSAYVFHHVFVQKREQRRLNAIFTKLEDQNYAVASLLLTVLVGALTWLLSYSLIGHGLLDFIFNNPGGVFAFITGGLSVFALFLTLRAVLEIRNSIQSFSSFIERLSSLIDETDPDDYITLCLHTPASGCLALPDHIWRRAFEKLQKTEAKLSLVCLSDAEMLQWYKTFLLEIGGNEQRLGEMKRRIIAGFHASNAIKHKASGQEPITPAQDDDLPSDQEGKFSVETIPSLMGTSWSMIPGVYMIANRKHAIVATPFFLPRRNQKEPLGLFNDRVEMIGFETSDKNVVDAVKHEIARIRLHIASAGEIIEDENTYNKLDAQTLESELDSYIETLATPKN